VQVITIGYWSTSTRDIVFFSVERNHWHGVEATGVPKIVIWHIMTSVLDISQMMQCTRSVNILSSY